MAWSEARSTPSRCSLAEPSGQIRATAAARLPAAVSGQMTISRPAYGRAVDCADRHPHAPSGASLSVGSRKRRFKRRYNRGRPGFVVPRSPMIRCTYRPKTRPNSEVTRLQTLTQNESIYFRTYIVIPAPAGIQGRSPVARPRPEPVLGPAEGRTRGSGQATPAFAGVSAPREGALSARCKSVPEPVAGSVIEGNCVAVRRGGEQPEVNRQSVG